MDKKTHCLKYCTKIKLLTLFQAYQFNVIPNFGNESNELESDKKSKYFMVLNSLDVLSFKLVKYLKIMELGNTSGAPVMKQGCTGTQIKNLLYALALL